MTTNPTEIQGAWTRGWTLGRHTTFSTFLGYDEHGHAQYNTTRSPLGELLFQLKYRGQNTVEQVADVMAAFFDDKPNTLQRIDVILPVPPSTHRQVQPVMQVAAAIAKKLRKAIPGNAIQKTKETPSLKNIHDPEERRELLDGAFEIDRNQVRGKGSC